MKNRYLENERMLLERVSSGDQKAFAIIFEYYSGFIYSFALKLTRSETTAEEIVQEIFLKIWTSRTQLPAVENLGAYLNRITRNHTYNILKRLSHKALVDSELSKQMSEVSNDTENEIYFKDASQSLNKAIEKLTPQQKVVYTLCHQEGLKYNEVADRLNIKTSTVHSHMKQALQSIRAYFLRLTPLFIYFFFRIFL
ncbi:RNA polymerase sigma-70 factor (ECF subfamily) [Mucilaginibacter frigoritolerans]|uniref:RNA polymerase sigma-70 factor (ECF subfamily) n=1 Tax=Mucilaginibacter frigoritolerans TaxID=652788 RepID=A0A562UGN8_9SPHI|nr:RNA polymerase sigma-70 factor [Mucilaginibacter frigoritolerans]TWJ04968.1 RNA polymerase sigma-70 factor (ECF subfamily) [Mucilaginibacter frigoritolerans]